jgi:hypothetical protein
LSSSLESLKDDGTGSSSSAVVDLAGPTLPALKLLIERAFSNSTSLDSSTSKSTDSKSLIHVLHGFITQTLQNIEDASRKLEEKSATISMRLRNNLLACVLVFTSVPPEVQISRAALEDYCAILSRLFLNDSTEVSYSHRTKNES